MTNQQSGGNGAVLGRLYDKFLFLIHFLKSPLALSTPVECSRKIANTIGSELRRHDVHRVVELGAGLGSITKGILDALPDQEKPLCVEREAAFCARLRKRFGNSVVVINGNAEDLPRIVAGTPYELPDAIVCSVPLNNERAPALCRIIAEQLQGQGVYLQVSFTKSLIEPHFNILKSYSFLTNIPPERVHVATPKAGDVSVAPG